MKQEAGPKKRRKKPVTPESKKKWRLKMKMGLEKKIEPIMNLGISKIQAIKIARGKLTVKQYFEQREELERLSKLHNLNKETIVNIFKTGRTIEGYLQAKLLRKTGNKLLVQCMEKKTPLVLRLYKKLRRTGIITEVDQYEIKFDDQESGETLSLSKINIKYLYKPDMESAVKESVKINKAIKEKNIEPAVKRADRYRLASATIRKAMAEKAKVKVTLNEGEFFKGVVDWFDKFHIMLKLIPEAAVLIFRHAIYDFKILKK